MSAPDRPKYRYPYRWAEPICQRVCEKYARATNSLAKIAGISTTEVRKRLTYSLMTGNSTVWCRNKALLRYLENTEFGDFRHLTVQERRRYLTFVQYDLENRYFDGLEDRKYP